MVGPAKGALSCDHFSPAKTNLPQWMGDSSSQTQKTSVRRIAHRTLWDSSLARIHVWWPKIDQDITNMLHRCSPCQSNRSKPALVSVHSSIWSTPVLQRIHIDFAGPFLCRMFLLVVDSHSMVRSGSITHQSVFREDHSVLFARYGLPDQLISDNSPQFVSHAFKQFPRNNGVKHIRTSPRHPASNGSVERFVRTFKDCFKTRRQDPGDLKQKLDRFLFSYRTTASGNFFQT